MEKPHALVQLIEELDSEEESSVVTIEDSHATVYLADDDKGMRLNRREVELLLHDTNTVRQFFEALDEPEDCSVELCSVRLEQDVQDALERCFVSVDEV
jgi:hypothetical protein